MQVRWRILLKPGSPLLAGDFEAEMSKITVTYQTLDNWSGFPQLLKI
jgi:hypothetical protein